MIKRVVLYVPGTLDDAEERIRSAPGFDWTFLEPPRLVTTITGRRVEASIQRPGRNSFGVVFSGTLEDVAGGLLLRGRVGMPLTTLALLGAMVSVLSFYAVNGKSGAFQTLVGVVAVATFGGLGGRADAEYIVRQLEKLLDAWAV